MLPKKFRLTGRDDFQLILKEGEVLQGRFFGLAFYKTQNTGAPKVGLIVSNKISKKATERNRIKRVLRDVAASSIQDLPEVMLVFLAKKAAAGKEKKQLRQDAEGLLDKARILSEK